MGGAYFDQPAHRPSSTQWIIWPGRRKAALLELDPRYVDVIVERWQAATGRDAVLDGSGDSFGDLAAAKPRASDGAAQ